MEHVDNGPAGLRERVEEIAREQAELKVERESPPQGGRDKGRRVTITAEQLAAGDYDPTLKPSEIDVAE